MCVRLSAKEDGLLVKRERDICEVVVENEWVGGVSPVGLKNFDPSFFLFLCVCVCVGGVGGSRKGWGGYNSGVKGKI